MNHLLKWFVLLSACSVCYIKTELVSCEEGQLLCRDKEKCIPERYLCDGGGADCSDGSDEDPGMCEEIRKKSSDCSDKKVLNSMGHCTNISVACTKFNDASMFCSEKGRILNANDVLESLREKYFNLKNEASRKQDKTLKDLLVHLATSFNETLKIQNYSTGCPPLYVNIDGKCIALFSVAQVTWNEAKQFCEAISGRLAIIDKIQDYVALLTYLKLQGLETDFWIGGYFDSNSTSSTSSWMWLDQTDIVMGAPYWGLRSHPPRDTSCEKQGSLKDIKYTLAPQENRDGFCLAMDNKFHYYFSDQNCKEKRSPLCISIANEVNWEIDVFNKMLKNLQRNKNQ